MEFIWIIALLFLAFLISILPCMNLKTPKQPKVKWDDDTSGGFGDDIR